MSGTTWPKRPGREIVAICQRRQHRRIMMNIMKTMMGGVEGVLVYLEGGEHLQCQQGKKLGKNEKTERARCSQYGVLLCYCWNWEVQ